MPEEQKRYAEFKSTWGETTRKKEPPLAARFNEALVRRMVFQDRLKDLSKKRSARKAKKALCNESDDSEDSDEDFYTDSDFE